MPDAIWDENASAAYELGRESLLEPGVWVVFYWPDGDDIELHVFEDKDMALARAQDFAIELWDKYWEPDWPHPPTAWDEIYSIVLDHTGNIGDVITVTPQEIQT